MAQKKKKTAGGRTTEAVSTTVSSRAGPQPIVIRGYVQQVTFRAVDFGLLFGVRSQYAQMLK
jgi:hypothetical protein